MLDVAPPCATDAPTHAPEVQTCSQTRATNDCGIATDEHRCGIISDTQTTIAPQAGNPNFESRNIANTHETQTGLPGLTQTRALELEAALRKRALLHPKLHKYPTKASTRADATRSHDKRCSAHLQTMGTSVAVARCPRLDMTPTITDIESENTQYNILIHASEIGRTDTKNQRGSDPHGPRSQFRALRQRRA